MPLWLTVLKTVPWTDVIRNAPKIADTARKLWHNVGKSAPADQAPLSVVAQAASDEAQAIAALRTQVAAAEAATANLHEQMLASSELIQALAQQNAELIQRVDVLQLRLSWLAAVVAVIACAGIACGIAVLAR